MIRILGLLLAVLFIGGCARTQNGADDSGQSPWEDPTAPEYDFDDNDPGRLSSDPQKILESETQEAPHEGTQSYVFNDPVTPHKQYRVDLIDGQDKIVSVREKSDKPRKPTAREEAYALRRFTANFMRFERRRPNFVLDDPDDPRKHYIVRIWKGYDEVRVIWKDRINRVASPEERAKVLTLLEGHLRPLEEQEKRDYYRNRQRDEHARKNDVRPDLVRELQRSIEMLRDMKRDLTYEIKAAELVGRAGEEEVAKREQIERIESQIAYKETKKQVLLESLETRPPVGVNSDIRIEVYNIIEHLAAGLIAKDIEQLIKTEVHPLAWKVPGSFLKVRGEFLVVGTTAQVHASLRSFIPQLLERAQEALAPAEDEEVAPPPPPVEGDDVAPVPGASEGNEPPVDADKPAK